MKIAKAVLSAAAAAIITTGISAEEKAPEENKKSVPPITLFGSTDLSLSGYGGPLFQTTRINGKTAHLTGGRGGLIIDHSLVIGFSGYGLASPNRRSTLSGEKYEGEYPYMDFGYGGILTEYHFAAKNLLHFSIGATIGGGGIGFSNRYDDEDDDDEKSKKRTSRGKTFFVAEPEAGLYLNVTRWCRIGGIVSYRFTKGANIYEFKDKDFRGPGASFAAEFGWF